MTERAPVHRDRRRAEAFGSAAQSYDANRPHYPEALIAELVQRDGLRVLDVGAGTGIASMQLAQAGANVLAVEPDSQMARVASEKGLSVEVATFEAWDPAGRSFDMVVFAQSFHWVEPRLALRKVAALLNPGGRLALLWNRVAPVTPDRQQLDRAYAGLLDEWQRPSVYVEGDELGPLLTEAGLASERRRHVDHLHYPTERWVNMVTTYSNVLTLDPSVQEELRSRLEACIGDSGVDATNDALAVVCTVGDQVSTA
ncbi:MULTISPECIES: class I SAM-dependent methyltransferase [unclassified Mycobacterium]|uniref:class I SAM-dependent methyltransferase n=1 Tax=unclassified Mycobacterium TaxID=2642494 RepID=UPI0029C7A9C5|nr:MULTISPECIES: class I SAM-dependent methyltransferase [unclassified Mycobacterium]